MYSSKSPPTWESASHIIDAEADKLLDAGRAETDTAKRKAIYEQVDARSDAVAPAIFGSEVSGVFVGLNTFKLPPFEDNSKRFSARNTDFNSAWSKCSSSDGETIWRVRWSRLLSRSSAADDQRRCRHSFGR